MCSGWKQSFQLLHFTNCCGKQGECSSKAAFKSANILWQNVYVFKKLSVNKISLQVCVQVEDIVTKSVAFVRPRSKLGKF